MSYITKYITKKYYKTYITKKNVKIDLQYKIISCNCLECCVNNKENDSCYTYIYTIVKLYSYLNINQKCIVSWNFYRGCAKHLGNRYF